MHFFTDFKLKQFFSMVVIIHLHYADFKQFHFGRCKNVLHAQMRFFIINTVLYGSRFYNAYGLYIFCKTISIDYFTSFLGHCKFLDF